MDACTLAQVAYKAPLIFCIEAMHRLQKPEEDSPDNPILKVKGAKLKVKMCPAWLERTAPVLFQRRGQVPGSPARSAL